MKDYWVGRVIEHDNPTLRDTLYVREGGDRGLFFKGMTLDFFDMEAGNRVGKVEFDAVVIAENTDQACKNYLAGKKIEQTREGEDDGD